MGAKEWARRWPWLNSVGGLDLGLWVVTFVLCGLCVPVDSLPGTVAPAKWGNPSSWMSALDLSPLLFFCSVFTAEKISHCAYDSTDRWAFLHVESVEWFQTSGKKALNFCLCLTSDLALAPKVFGMIYMWGCKYWCSAVKKKESIFSCVAVQRRYSCRIIT